MRYPTRSCTGVDRAGFVVLLAALLCPGSLAAAATRSYGPFPKPDAGYVTDKAGLLTQEQEQQLESWLLQTEKRTGVEIAVVTIESMNDYPGTPNRSIEEFARALFDAYGIGNMPKNKGILLVVAAQDRKARIELGAGYDPARDKDADRIMQRKIVPYFRKGKYAAGVTSGVKALMREFGGMASVTPWGPWALAGGFVILILVVISLFRQGKRGWGWVVAGTGIVLILGLLLLARHMLEDMPNSINQPGGWGGGFGGGFSGGGGATGSW